MNIKFYYISIVRASLQHIYRVTKAVPAVEVLYMIYRIAVGSTLAQWKQQRWTYCISLIREHMLYEFKLGHSSTEATKNICCAKGELLFLFICLFVCLFGFYGISNFVGYLTPNPFLYKLLLATVVEGDQKTPFSIATTPRFWGGYYFFPWIAPLYPWYVPYIAEC